MATAILNLESGERVAEIGNSVKRFLTTLGCRDAWLADDIVQETLTKMHVNSARFDGKRSLMAWTFTIARNAFIDASRRARKPGLRGAGGGEDFDALHTVPDRTCPAGADLEDAELRHAVDEAITRLPDLQRIVVNLRKCGVRNDDIARRLRISPSHASTIYASAIDALRTVCC